MSTTTVQTKNNVPKLADLISGLKPWIQSVHPLCKAIPRIGETDFNNLVESIKTQGLLFPILVDESGQLLDGRSRILACHVAGVEITQDHIEMTDKDPEAIAQSNIARRHLSEDQKIMDAVSRELVRRRRLAAIRKRRGTDAKGKRQQAQLGTGSVPSKTGQKSTVKKTRGPKAIDETAKSTGISREKLSRGEKLLKKDPGLAKKVDYGMMSLSDAEQQAGIKPKTPKTKPKKKRKPDHRKNKSNQLWDSTLIPCCDKHSEIVDHANGMRVITTFDVTLLLHPVTKTWAIVFPDQETWRVSTTSGHEVDVYHSQPEALSHAESLITTSLLKSAK